MLLPLLVTLQSVFPGPPTAAPDVVVTGERLKAIYDQCRARGCTPLRDAQASIAWAETLFRDGRYDDAKNVLRDAAGRAKRHAASDPKPVAAVYEAYATVAWQEGDQFIYRQATAARVRTLRENLPAVDPAVVAASLALGDMWLRLRSNPDAERAYVAAECEGISAELPGVAIRARLARARLRHAAGDRRAADALLATVTELPGGDDPASRAAVEVTRLRMAAADGRAASTDALVAALRQASVAQPVLLSQPPYPAVAAQALERRPAPKGPYSDYELWKVSEATSSGAFITPILWADIGFRIRPDGATAEAEVLQGSPRRGWTAAYLKQIAGRRYSAVGPADGEGVYRVERFTLRPDYGRPSGSLIRRRVGWADLEVLDLTDPSAKVTAAR
jgi:hypothetical protein